jgi:hypothetical protein
VYLAMQTRREGATRVDDVRDAVVPASTGEGGEVTAGAAQTVVTLGILEGPTLAQVGLRGWPQGLSRGEGPRQREAEPKGEPLPEEMDAKVEGRENEGKERMKV